jgi:predicted nucleic acid-binding protein
LGLRVPDALHAATALAEGCTLFLTNDPIFHRVSGLSEVILSEVLATP